MRMKKMNEKKRENMIDVLVMLTPDRYDWCASYTCFLKKIKKRISISHLVEGN